MAGNSLGVGFQCRHWIGDVPDPDRHRVTAFNAQPGYRLPKLLRGTLPTFTYWLHPLKVRYDRAIGRARVNYGTE